MLSTLKIWYKIVYIKDYGNWFELSKISLGVQCIFYDENSNFSIYENSIRRDYLIH